MNFKKITASSLLVAGIAMSPHALAAQSFDGHTINVAFGMLDSNDAVNGNDAVNVDEKLIYLTNKKDVLASDWASPDEKDFYAVDGFSHHFDWDIDFNQNRIELTYVSIKADDHFHQYLYTWSAGFRFQDSENSLPDIINVRVDPAFAPLGFDPELITFDADNIYVNLKGSVCLYEEMLVSEAMGVMPACTNQMSPTGFNNRIILIVEFAAKETNDGTPSFYGAPSFHGNTINVTFELWDSDDVSSLLETKNEKHVLASDWTYHDEKDFYVYTPEIDFYDWDIDFNQNRIDLTYTSIEAENDRYRYFYDTARGFHFHDMHNSLPEIINVIVDDTFAPFGFDPELVTFDADNIYVNLRESMCLNKDMTGALRDKTRPLPDCHNTSSPTGFDNRISLIVEFAAKETIDEPTNDKVIIDNATIDELYDWMESKYPEFLPTHQESMVRSGYYSRSYQETGVYIGSLKGSLYVYYVHLGVMIDLGELGGWVEKMEKEKMDTEETDNK